jgi:hypothetical protein
VDTDDGGGENRQRHEADRGGKPLLAQGLLE